MPITPFHLGPGALLHGLAPRHVSFLAFAGVNALIDVESLYNLLNGREPVHAFLHTYIGATVAIALLLAVFVILRWAGKRWRWADVFQWQSLSLTQAGIGAALGAYSHVVLDGVMHADIRPLWPFSDGNALLGVLSLGTLHLFCLVAGVIGLGGMGLRAFVRSRYAGRE